MTKVNVAYDLPFEFCSICDNFEPVTNTLYCDDELYKTKRCECDRICLNAVNMYAKDLQKKFHNKIENDLLKEKKEYGTDRQGRGD